MVLECTRDRRGAGREYPLVKDPVGCLLVEDKGDAVSLFRNLT